MALALFQSFQLLDFLAVGSAMAVAGLLFMTFPGIARRTALHAESAEVVLTRRL